MNVMGQVIGLKDRGKTEHTLGLVRSGVRGGGANCSLARMWVLGSSIAGSIPTSARFVTPFRCWLVLVFNVIGISPILLLPYPNEMLERLTNGIKSCRTLCGPFALGDSSLDRH